MSMDSVLGQPGYVNSDTAVQIFDKIKEDIIAEEKSKSQRQSQEIKKKARAQINQKTKEVEELASQLGDLLLARKKSVEALLRPSLTTWSRKPLILGGLLLLVAVAGLFGSTYLSGRLQLIAVVVSCVILILGLFGVTIPSVKEALKAVEIRRLKRRLIDFGFEDLADEVQIDLDRATIGWRTNLQLISPEDSADDL